MDSFPIITIHFYLLPYNMKDECFFPPPSMFVILGPSIEWPQQSRLNIYQHGRNVFKTCRKLKMLENISNLMASYFPSLNVYWHWLGGARSWDFGQIRFFYWISDILIQISLHTDFQSSRPFCVQTVCVRFLLIVSKQACTPKSSFLCLTTLNGGIVVVVWAELELSVRL